MPMNATPANDALLRPATPYEVAAALMHHQPAAAFRSLFVLYGYGSDLIDRVSLAEVATLDARLEAHSDERRYVIDQLHLTTLGYPRRIELAGAWPQFYCFAHCSIRQFPVFFALREPSQVPLIETLLTRLVGEATVQYQDWRLENAYEWALISTSAARGDLWPQAGFSLDAAVAWRLMRPITEMGGRSPVLEWHLMKALERNHVEALPLMTVITDAQGHLLRKVDQHVLQAFRARSDAAPPTSHSVALAPDREPLVRVSLRGPEKALDTAAVKHKLLPPDQGLNTVPLSTPLSANPNVVPLHRLAG
jgi:hypothetical protein